MPPYADVYVLSTARTAEAVSRFLDRFAPDREETEHDYGVSWHEPGEIRFDCVADLVAYLTDHPNEPYSIYWRNTAEGGPAFAMTFFTTDGAVILGLSCDEERADHWLAELKKFAGSDAGYKAVEQPPPDSAAEFFRLCR